MLAIADVAVTVSDASTAAKWWSEKLGFAVHYVGGEEGSHAVMVAPSGDRFLLHLCEGFEPVEPGNTGIAFMSDDLEPMVRRMRSAGVRFPEPLKRESWGASAKFADPDGNVYWLLEAPTAFIEGELGRRAPAPTPTQRPPAARKG
jgi:catechol 2,3-dioxygenase-like lactoylglutathione lyase family enzyme